MTTNDTPSPTKSGTPAALSITLHPTTDTWNGIHLFQTFDYNISNPEEIAKRYDFVWGAQIDHVRYLRDANPSIFLTYYTTFNRDNGTFSNNAEAQGLSFWRTAHPDWILYKCDRTTPAYGQDTHLPLDFTNPDVVGWQIQTYADPAEAAGYDGIAADGVDLDNRAGACGIYKNGTWVQLYSGKLNDPQWRSAIIVWLALTQHALHALPRPMALIPNISFGHIALNDPQMRQIVDHVDGVVDEGGFTHYGNSYVTGSEWVQRIGFMEYVQAQSKPYYIINLFRSVGQAEIQWALASYLMGKGHEASLFISNLTGYGTESLYKEYSAPIGSPIGPMIQTSGLYIRLFTKGISIVNPSPSETCVLTLDDGKHYINLYGQQADPLVTLLPQSGLVLLTS